MVDLTGKIAIVTGGARGIGHTIATELLKCGATVVAADVLTGTPASFDGRTAEAATMDVTDAASVETVVTDVLARHGHVDILVNNAGITRDQLLMRMKREEWDKVIAVNLTGTFICTQAVLRPMMRQKSGRIISISSVVGQMGNAGQSNYAASKAGIIGLSKSLAREVASRQVTVNVVAPGLIDTDMTKALTEDTRKAWLSAVPLDRFGTPEDVASAVCFLASPEASYITGQVLAVNGGMYT